jgi:hypothetical protein
MNGAQILQDALIGQVSTDWSIAAVADFDADGNADIVWRNLSTGQVAIWLMKGVMVASAAVVATVATTWSIIGSGDFFGAGSGSILWRDSAGNLGVWQLQGATVDRSVSLGAVSTNWVVVENGDFNGDGVADLLGRDTSTGAVAIWFFQSGGFPTSTATVGTVPSDWVIQNTNVN